MPSDFYTVDNADTKIYPAPLVPDRPPRLWKIQSVICALLLLAVVICRLYFPTAAAAIQDWLVGDGQDQVTAAVDALDQGLDTAIAVFRDALGTP